MTKNTQKEINTVSNLIVDMTLKGATSEELSKAINHSKNLIDCSKFDLDYTQSEKDNDIETLKSVYLGV